MTIEYLTVTFYNSTAKVLRKDVAMLSSGLYILKFAIFDYLNSFEILGKGSTVGILICILPY